MANVAYGRVRPFGFTKAAASSRSVTATTGAPFNRFSVNATPSEKANTPRNADTTDGSVVRNERIGPTSSDSWLW